MHLLNPLYRFLTAVIYARRWIAIAVIAALATVSSCAADQSKDLPVATYGFEQWAGVVAKAMSFGGRNQEQSLAALKTFQSTVTAKMQEQVTIGHSLCFCIQGAVCCFVSLYPIFALQNCLFP